MKITRSIIRILILSCLLTSAFDLLFAMPDNDSSHWFTEMMSSKLLMAACVWAFARLYPRWRENDEWIKTFDRWNSDPR